MQGFDFDDADLPDVCAAQRGLDDLCPGRGDALFYAAKRQVGGEGAVFRWKSQVGGGSFKSCVKRFECGRGLYSGPDHAWPPGGGEGSQSANGYIMAGVLHRQFCEHVCQIVYIGWCNVSQKFEGEMDVAGGDPAHQRGANGLAQRGGLGRNLLLNRYGDFERNEGAQQTHRVVQPGGMIDGPEFCACCITSSTACLSSR